jgi:hypothetical protein
MKSLKRLVRIHKQVLCRTWSLSFLLSSQRPPSGIDNVNRSRFHQPLGRNMLSFLQSRFIIPTWLLSGDHLRPQPYSPRSSE